DVHGTFANPSADIGATAAGLTAYGEKIDTATAEIHYSPETLVLLRGRMEANGARIDASGKFDHPRNDLRNGEAQFQIASAGISLARIEHVRRVRQDIDGQVQFQANGAARIVNGIAQLETLKSETDLHNFSIAGEKLGDATLTANTKGVELTASVNGTIGETKIHGQGDWTLEGDYPGQGSVEFSRTTFAELRRLTARATKLERLPFEGFFEGSATVRGPLKKPGDLRAELRIPVIEMDPNPELRPKAGVSAKDLLLKNDGPVVLEGNTRSIDIKSAKFSAKDTSIEAAGKFALDSTTPWNLTAKGSINLAILQLFNADILGSGHASIDARARGTLDDPQVAGRMELHDASLYLNDVPNGIDHANGAIIFDRNRATIERLSAQTGGGQITLGGFVGFTHPVLTYRLFAHAEQVRYRSPEGISMTANADLSISGTSDISILSGTVNVTRVALNPRTDVGALLAETAKPVAISQNPNEYLRGIQLDIRVQNAQTLEIDTALTSNVQAEADLRIRGNLQRPSILGTMSITEGRIEFFGNKYVITRGEVHFYNLARIEPVIDFDLETEVRGVTVNVSFSGPINKLNLTYRSDPPLDSNQIVALLAVGRSPSMSSGLESTQTSQSNFMATGTNALLSQAIAAPASGRLQRFFGVSHLKIDPELNDLSSIPQARLTLEQQVSRDITLTYITNLARTDEQIVRIEWDLSRKWSIVALRDENGEFGVNFQYRKQFK
ncbi:MAG TPA: translocation/assembly module TamB domain-containing protein, partial [Bryobacteraceae bacterium]|nr:translocation/assembly module TamB domain-containing protein [Bryobacteraceae bacterium]